MAIHTCLVTYIYLVTYICPTKFIVVLVFVRPNSSYVRPKLKVIGQMSCQVKYLFAALMPYLYTYYIDLIDGLSDSVCRQQLALTSMRQTVQFTKFLLVVLVCSQS
jgi:hypothetical protein